MPREFAGCGAEFARRGAGTVMPVDVLDAAGYNHAMRLPPTGLPVESIFESLLESLSIHGTAVLQAEAGAGKSTLVPLALAAGRPGGGKILVLQPRRLAAEATARRMADLIGEDVGSTVGFRTGIESRVSKNSRIEVLTEGILTRMLQNDPVLPGVDLLIFDEFHERSVQADLGLAFALEVRASIRPDLQILVMSATIDTVALSGLLGKDSPCIRVPGRNFPVETVWRPLSIDYWNNAEGFLASLAEATCDLVAESEGDILVFLPGRFEIERVAGILESRLSEMPILRLYGGMRGEDQSRVLEPETQSGQAGRRRLILATNIAETSLTIPGIRTVVDSGLQRVNRFDSRLGMDRLLTERVSQASAEQRKGRAGRLSAGRCVRLWDPSLPLQAYLVPESERGDLGNMVLQATLWASPLSLLSPPSPGLWQSALRLLRGLGAIDRDGDGLKPRGREMALSGLSPRLARVLSENKSALACACAALLSEDALPSQEDGADFAEVTVRFLRDNERGIPARDARSARARVLFSRHMKNAGRFAGPGSTDSTEDVNAALAQILAPAFWDRIAHLEEIKGQDSLRAEYQLSNGARARLRIPKERHAPEWLIVLGADIRDDFVRVSFYVEIPSVDPSGKTSPTVPDFLAKILADSVETTETVEFVGLRPRSTKRLRLGRLTLSETPTGSPGGETVSQAFLAELRTRGLEILPWTEASRKWLTRVRWALARTESREAPEIFSSRRLSDSGLMNSVETWLLPYLSTRGGPVLDAETLASALRAIFSREEERFLEEQAPSSLLMPSGSRRGIEYPDDPDAAPVLAVRIQEIFGMKKQPTILGVPLILHLLSPSGRPLQISTDLEGFWARTYAEVRKEMRGRYPRHYWPEDPLIAEPTSRPKPRGT